MGFFGINGVLILVVWKEVLVWEPFEVDTANYNGMTCTNCRESAIRAEIRIASEEGILIWGLWWISTCPPKEDVWLLTGLEFERFRWTKCWNPQLQSRSTRTFSTFADLQMYFHGTKMLDYVPFPIGLHPILLKGISLLTASPAYISSQFWPKRDVSEEENGLHFEFGF